jgi:recombination protein RecA
VGEFDIMFGEGISTAGCILDLGTEYDVVQKAGSWFSYKGDKIGQGRDAAKEYLKSHPDIAAEIEHAIRVKAGVDPETLMAGGVV